MCQWNCLPLGICYKTLTSNLNFIGPNDHHANCLNSAVLQPTLERLHVIQVIQCMILQCNTWSADRNFYKVGSLYRGPGEPVTLGVHVTDDVILHPCTYMCVSYVLCTHVLVRRCHAGLLKWRTELGQPNHAWPTVQVSS